MPAPGGAAGNTLKHYDQDKLKVIAVQDIGPNTILTQAGATIPDSDTESVPDSDGIFWVAAVDLGPNAESGDGVLAHFTLETAAAGAADLTLVR